MKTKKPQHKAATVPLDSLDETMQLYNGWLAYLLTRLGESTVRVERADLANALRTLSCRVERDGEAYIIRMGAEEDAATDGCEAISGADGDAVSDGMAAPADGRDTDVCNRA